MTLLHGVSGNNMADAQAHKAEATVATREVNSCRYVYNSASSKTLQSCLLILCLEGKLSAQRR
jgi:hypothetical protein